MAKPKVATAALAGCFGCHMSFLDIDDRIVKLIELVDFDKSPVDDIKRFTGPVDVGIIEGAVSVGELAAGQTVTTTDDFTVSLNTSHGNDVFEILFVITYLDAEGNPQAVKYMDAISLNN